MKQCPYCNQEIQDDVKKCTFCTASLISEAQIKWYFRTHVLIVGFLCVGPFILPLVWLNPHLSQKKKIVITVITLAFTYLLTVWVMRAVSSIVEYYKLVFENIP